jgi:flagellar basal-body rod protein FlgC
LTEEQAKVFESLDISTSGLVANRVRMDIIAGNVANKDVTRQADGTPTPYRRRVALLAPGNPAAGDGAAGVHVAKIVQDPSPFHLREDPGHPDAIKEGPQAGYLRLPNVSYHTEMVDALQATRAYEANVTVMDMSKRMITNTLRMLA